MKNVLVNASINFLKLCRFVLWYTSGVVVVFYLLPVLGIFIEGKYDALTNFVKIFIFIGFFAVIAIWQLFALKERL